MVILFSFVISLLWDESLTEMKIVPHLFLLGTQVSFVDFVGLDDDGDGVHDFDAVGGEAHSLGGIVCDQTDMRGIEIAQDLRSDAVVALVSFETEFEIGFHGVAAEFLQMIGAQLVHQTDTTALLAHVEDQAFALFVHHLHGAVQLLAAVAFGRAEDVARGTGRVNPHHDRLAVRPFALLESQMGSTVVELGVGDELEVAPSGGQVDFLFLADQFLALQTVGNELLNARDFEVELMRHLHQLG